jgi:TnpA family transposase
MGAESTMHSKRTQTDLALAMFDRLGKAKRTFFFLEYLRVKRKFSSECDGRRLAGVVFI